MILHPSVIALLTGSVLAAGLLLRAAWHGLSILRRWDLSSGSALQLALERRTYLISTVVGLVLAFELLALLLFVRTADALAPLFTGAMCAAGTLAANGWGYPALLLRIGVAVLAGLWLILSHVDDLGHDYPLIRTKYAFLLALAPLVLVEGAIQARYFLALRPEVITSCCGSLFARDGAGAGAVLARLPALPAAIAFYGSLGAAIAAATIHFRTAGVRSAGALAIASALALVTGLAGIVSLVSPYVYELPSHRCPFCLLHAEYRWVGYPLYAALIVAAISGLGVGVVAPARRHASLAARLPALQRRLATWAGAGFGIVVAVATGLILASGLRR